eukprot:jgi/Chrzof1/336/Cz01g12020.t1
MSDPYPRSVEEIFEDFAKRRAGLLRALTDEVDDFYQQCDPDRDNLCLYGERNGGWSVDLPAEEVPPELPEPCLGVNFARDGMARKDWLALVAVHSDAWLMAVAFFYAVKLDAAGRARLFKQINNYPTLFEVVTGRANKGGRSAGGGGGGGGHKALPAKRKPETSAPAPTPSAVGMPYGMHSEPAASRQPNPTGRRVTYNDIDVSLRGRRAQLFWPDDQQWYAVFIDDINPNRKTAKILYVTGEFEDLDLDEIVRDGHMMLLPP